MVEKLKGFGCIKYRNFGVKLLVSLFRLLWNIFPFLINSDFMDDLIGYYTIYIVAVNKLQLRGPIGLSSTEDPV
jgi:hypothetical protein